MCKYIQALNVLLAHSVNLPAQIRATLKSTFLHIHERSRSGVKSVTIRQDQSNKLGNINLKSIGYMTNYKVPAYIDGK